MKKTYKIISIASAIAIGVGAAALPVYADTAHEYYSTTGFCDVCGKTVNEGNHTNKITNNKGGVVEGKGNRKSIPIVTENTVTLKLNGDLVNIECKSGTYKEIFDYLKNKGYSDFTVKNYWNTTVYSWYKYDSNKICSAIINDNTEDETDGIPILPEAEVKIYTRTLVIDGKETVIKCSSGTYKEVFDYIDNLGYKNYKVKDQWGTIVYSWYTVNVDCKCYIA